MERQHLDRPVSGGYLLDRPARPARAAHRAWSSPLEPEPLERGVVTAPPRAHLHDELEEDLPAEQLLDLRPGADADLADHLAALTARICFCDSVSTRPNARRSLSSNSSSSTEIECRTSSRVSWSAFSRISSVIRWLAV